MILLSLMEIALLITKLPYVKSCRFGANLLQSNTLNVKITLKWIVWHNICTYMTTRTNVHWNIWEIHTISHIWSVQLPVSWLVLIIFHLANCNSFPLLSTFSLIFSMRWQSNVRMHMLSRPGALKLRNLSLIILSWEHW